MRRVIVLTGSHLVGDKVRAAAKAITVATVTCLDQVGGARAGATLVVDPTAVHPCCVRTLQVWWRHRTLRQVLYLCLPADPVVLLSLPQAHPGRPIDLDAIGAALTSDPPHPPAWMFWRIRRRLFALAEQDGHLRRLISIVRRHDHKAYTEKELAQILRISARHLSRLARTWFGCPARVVLALLRVDHLANELRRTEAGLRELALVHGYSSRQSMNRLFRAYTGLTPSAYRRRCRKAMSENDPPMSDLGPFPGAVRGGIGLAQATTTSTHPIGGSHGETIAAEPPRAAVPLPADRTVRWND